jgi:hypothetical protein
MCALEWRTYGRFGIQWVFYMNLLKIPQGEASAAGERELGRGIAGLHPRSSRRLA